MDDDTAVIAPVDYAGQPADVAALRSLSGASRAVIVEDTAYSPPGSAPRSTIYLPVHHHPWFRGHGHADVSCPVAEAAYRELLSLPLFPALTTADQDRVVGELRRLLHA